jgi:hypothetical protein
MLSNILPPEEQKLLDDALAESDNMLVNSLHNDQRRRRQSFIGKGVLAVAILAVLAWLYAGAIVPALSPVDLEIVSTSLEDLRSTVVTYDLSFDQVLDEQLSKYDESRLAAFPVGAWPKGLALSFVDKQIDKFRACDDDLIDYNAALPGSYLFTQPLKRSLQIENYQTLIFAEGIAEQGAVMVNSYTVLYCRGDMAGVVNSQSYSTTVVTGNVSGKLLNDSYGHWVIKGDLTGDFTNKSAGTLRVLGQFSGEIDLGNQRDRRFAKVFLAGKSAAAQLERITGRGIVYLEKSDLADGVHQLRDLTVVVGEHQPLMQHEPMGQGGFDDVANDPQFKRAWKDFFNRDYAKSEQMFRELLAREPDNPNIMNGLGWSLLNQKKHDEAKPLFEKTIAVNKKAWGSLSGLAVVLKYEGKTDEAIALWERIAANTTGPNDATANLADVAVERKQYGKALDYYKKMLEWYPDRESIRDKIAEIEAKLQATEN